MDKVEALTAGELLAANSDLEERLGSLNIVVTYDAEFDIFLLSLGEPQPAITEEISSGHGLQVRLDPETLKIVGFEILGFQSRYLKAHPDFLPHFEALFEKPKSPIERQNIPSTGPQHKRAQEAIRKLLPA
ncbi:MAG: DUF2283 domain-containing protein [Chloroflexi bacterium]|nr:DUF2283 domain-containing protein [Chloroflexota bacterium]